MEEPVCSLPPLFQASPELPVQRRIEHLLDVPERPDAGPDLAHPGQIERLKRADRTDVEMQSATPAGTRRGELLIPEQDGAGDDPRPELKEHHGSRRRMQPRRAVRKHAAGLRQIAPKAIRLDLRNTLAAKAANLVAHRPNPHRGDATQSFNPLPARICRMHFSIRDSRVLDCLAPEK